MSIIPSASSNDTTTTVPGEDSHEAAVARYLSTPYTNDFPAAPMAPDREQEIRNRKLDEVTAGPWLIADGSNGCPVVYVETLRDGRAGARVLLSADGATEADVQFVASARKSVPELLAEVSDLRAQVAELEAQRDRRRGRLVALQNDALNMRGSLSPNGEPRKVPFELGETLTPAVDWLIARVAELDGRRRQTTPVEAFAYDMDTALVNLPPAERRGADAVLQVLRARAAEAVTPSTTEAAS